MIETNVIERIDKKIDELSYKLGDPENVYLITYVLRDIKDLLETIVDEINSKKEE